MEYKSYYKELLEIKPAKSHEKKGIEQDVNSRSEEIKEAAKSQPAGRSNNRKYGNRSM